MNSWIGRVVPVILGLSFFAMAQHGSSTAATSKRFQWDYRRSIELDLKDDLKDNKALTTEQKKALVTAISAQYRSRKGDPDALSPREIREIAVHTRIQLFDLKHDGINEVIAQPVGEDAGCGATGNCPIWIFEPSPAGYNLLLNGTAQTFTIQPDSASGFHDLVLGQHASASEQVLYLYSFKNGRYRRGTCYEANWLIFTAKQFRELKEPRISLCNWK